MSPTFPLYACHKQVRAAEIVSVDPTTRRIQVAFPEGGETQGRWSIMVEDSWLEKFSPKPGDWLVEYADGYRSVSPAKAWLAGYELIDEDQADESWKAKADADGTSSDVKAPDAKDAGGGVSTETM